MVAQVVPQRVRYAVDLVDPAPDARVLELGCGPGAAAELVCARLATGRLLAVDRSAVATERTARRCAAAVAAGRLVVRTAALRELDPAAAVADLGGPAVAAFTVNVNAFWTGPATAELAVLHAVLRPGGWLHVCYGDGPSGPDRVGDTVGSALRGQGFVEVGLRRGAGGFAISGQSAEQGG